MDSNNSEPLNNSEQDARTTNNNIELEYDPDTTTTISRGVGKCPNCGNVIDDNIIKSQAQTGILDHQLYAVAYKKGKGSLEFRTPEDVDFEGIINSQKQLQKITDLYNLYNFPDEEVVFGDKTNELLRYGMDKWSKLFNPRQLLTLVTYVEIINEAKTLIQSEYEWEKSQAISTYLALVLDRCVDMNSRLSGQKEVMTHIGRASATHSLNLMWNYSESNGANFLYPWCAKTVASEYIELCQLLQTKSH
ncbi:MAG: DNA methylase, partial [Dolichospermum sp.]